MGEGSKAGMLELQAWGLVQSGKCKAMLAGVWQKCIMSFMAVRCAVTSRQCFLFGFLLVGSTQSAPHVPVSCPMSACLDPELARSSQKCRQVCVAHLPSVPKEIPSVSHTIREGYDSGHARFL